MRSVHLIRHGTVVDDGVHRYIGRTDLPMSAAGIAQIEALVAVYAEAPPFAAIWCSDLVRSRRTAEILAAGRAIPIVVDPRLREIDMGAWEGLDRAVVAATRPEDHAARGRDILGFRPPGGESFADVLARILPAWREMTDAAGETRIAVAGHAGVNRLLLCHVLGMPAAKLFCLAKDPGCVDVVEWRHGEPVVRLLDAGPEAVAEWRGSACRSRNGR